MTYTHMTRFMATAAGLLGSAAFVALASLPGVAQSTVNTQESNSETRTYTYPGPSETPSGSPSVPGTSTYDDPGAVQESQPDQEARRDSYSTPQNPTVEPYRGSGVEPAEIPSGSDQGASDTDMNSSLPASSDDLIAQSSTRGEEVEDGPSAVGEGVPGPSETPSGSPSVPGVSEVDDPGLADSQERSRSAVERDAMNSPNSSSSDNSIGPSAVPGEGVPGPSETPSGSPSVPGVSVYDDPNEESNTEMGTPGQGSVDDSRRDGPSAVPGESLPGPSETPSGSPSVPGTSGVDDPGRAN